MNCEQQYQDIAPAVEVGIVTARGGGNSLDHCLLVYFRLGEGGGSVIWVFLKYGEGGVRVGGVGW